MPALQEYRHKRNFRRTPEPGPRVATRRQKALIFVVQEHHASHLHYDFRLEWDGVLKSWAVPKGPSMDPSVKRLAVEVEDHPLSYAKFHGVIPAHQYGAGTVEIWDHGHWIPEGDVDEGLEKGHLDFTLKGGRLKGRWMLLRTRRPGAAKPQWLLIKRTEDADRIEKPVAPAVGANPFSGRKGKTRVAKKKSTEDELAFVSPQLALLVDAPPEGPEWVHENKFDGYRIQAHVHDGAVTLWTRTQKDWTAKYPTVAKALANLKIRSAIFDGEMVWEDRRGHFSFQGLQNAKEQAEARQIHYYVFDLLYLNGRDLRPEPLLERKRRLREALGKDQTLRAGPLRYTEHVKGDAARLFSRACDRRSEGLISKQADAPWSQGRLPVWVKSKCHRRQEFVIGGYTEGEGLRQGTIGALLLGVHDGGHFRYSGKVGTGFNRENLRDVLAKLEKLETKRTPFDENAKFVPRRKVHWVRPKLVAEIAFSEWTQDGILRAPVFHGLREDKPASQVRAEVEHSEKEIETRGPARKKAGLTHADKVLYDEEGLTKQAVADFYRKVAKWMMPHLQDRPVSLYRCPNGTSHSCFFQKHAGDVELPSGVSSFTITEKGGTADYLVTQSAEGLSAFAQWGALELHPWNATVSHLEKPDQFIMDFDPDPNIPWTGVVDACLMLKEILDDLELPSYVKVTGGKGVHVQVPVQPRYTWEQILQFSHALARELVSREPKLFLDRNTKSDRRGKIFVDYLRNSRGATAVAPYSLRAHKRSSVAMPVSWRELKKLGGSDIFTLENALKHLDTRKIDPWKDYAKNRPRIGILRS